MSILQVLTAIELVGGRKGTLLHLVEDNLHVDKLTPAQVDVHLGTEELFGQQGDIETVGVEASQVATLDVVGYATCHFLERRAVGHIGIIDAMYSRCRLGNMHTRIDAHRLRLFVSIRINFEITNLDDTIAIDISTSGLQIEEHQWIFQIQFHIICLK